MSKNRYLNIFANGIVKENPTFRLVLGMCPTLAVTTSMFNGLGMGLATTFVLFFSNMIISLLKKIIPEKVRIPAYIVVIASFVINCIIFARAESFASVKPVLDSMVDGLSMGLGFTLSLTLLGAFRELFSAGTILGVQILGDWFPTLTVLGTPAGGFLVLGLAMAVFNAVYQAVDRRKEAKKGGAR